MSITFRLACPMRITPMSCLLRLVTAAESKGWQSQTLHALWKMVCSTCRPLRDRPPSRVPRGRPACSPGLLRPQSLWARLIGPRAWMRPSRMRTLQTPQPPLTQPTGMPLRPSRTMPVSRLSLPAQGKVSSVCATWMANLGRVSNRLIVVTPAERGDCAWPVRRPPRGTSRCRCRARTIGPASGS